MGHCHAVPSPSHIPDLLRAYFELLQRTLLFCPSSVFPDLFASTIHLAIACLMHLDQREALRAVVVYVNHVVTKRETPALISYRSAVDSAFTSQQAPLWIAMVTLLTATCPTTVLPTVIHLAFALMTTYGPSMHPAVANALLNQPNADAPLSIGNRQRVYATLVQYVSLLCCVCTSFTTNYEERKFTAFVKDYAKVCRKELPVEHLVDHFVA
ncbi:hypothetical protein DYB32_007724 [Aphanomyces invadans]|uniref:Uncharacterized protein n=1 Tax=Aphanomyces invadans TaxID=157072 RepID=A0A418ARB5_9STRA|nr:hypothetical protein DYB32_007724 [Aphanomyces invadans]